MLPSARMVFDGFHITSSAFFVFNYLIFVDTVKSPFYAELAFTATEIRKRAASKVKNITI